LFFSITHVIVLYWSPTGVRRARREFGDARGHRQRLLGRLSQAILRNARSVGRWWWLCGWNCHRDIFVIRGTSSDVSVQFVGPRVLFPGRLSRAWTAAAVPIFIVCDGNI
jgi:hypothetical protein